MNVRIGDRFYWETVGRTWEVTEVINEESMKCVNVSDPLSYYQKSIQVYDINHWVTSSNCRYIGNFGKDSKFTELYNLLNTP